MAQAWIVRAGRNDEYEDRSFKDGIVAIGWNRVADLTKCLSREDVGRLVQATYPERAERVIDGHTAQLYVFRSLMKPGDLVVLLRSNSPDVAIGKIVGEYQYATDGPPHHFRPVQWHHREVRRGEIGPDFRDPPALSVVYRVSKGSLQDRLWELAGGFAPPARPTVPEVPLDVPEPATSTAYVNLSRNLNYARNLAAAGSHLQQLQVNLFEVTDVYRAAWVQAVAAIDHWVHQEITDRMLRLSEKPGLPRPDGYLKFNLPLDLIEEVHAGRLSLTEALERGLRISLAYKTYQSPEKIQEGLAHVANVKSLWQRVAKALSEQAGSDGNVTGPAVQAKLKEIVHRRNKIAHEYDEVSANPPTKREIGVAETMQTIEWLDQLAVALLVVLDQE